MICGQAIRALTPEEIEQRKVDRNARYHRLYVQARDALDAEYREQFGGFHCFKPSHDAIHHRVVLMMNSQD